MAAKKKAVKKKAAKKSAGKALATVSKNKSIDNWQERLGAMAKADSARGHKMGESQFISTEGGIFSFQGAQIGEGKVLTAVITDFAYENAFYDSVYDADNPAPPACFAIGDDPDELTPDESSPSLQVAKGEMCENCDMNEWATSVTGRGKACKNGARIALVNADNMELVNAAAEPAFLRAAPTSLKHFEKYKNKISKVTGKPLLACITEIELVPNKTWHELHFTLSEFIEDEQTLQNMLAVHDTYRDILREPYDVSSYGEQRQPARRGGGKKKAAKKKAAKKKARAAKY